jgi:hypothetical protein
LGRRFVGLKSPEEDTGVLLAVRDGIAGRWGVLLTVER